MANGGAPRRGALQVAEVAHEGIELWNMAKEYQRKAAQLGDLPDIGDTPPNMVR